MDIKMKYGLIGEKLAHSFSPEIHKEFGNDDYVLCPIKKDKLADFLRAKDFCGINVTIPYKQDVIPYLDEIDKTAEQIGAVNTIIKDKNGKLIGYNTDCYGFSALLSYNNISVKNKKCLVLGSGGASKTACHVLNESQVSECIVISRHGENNYENISSHYDADIIINTTPLGMYPENGKSAVDCSLFKNLQAAVDLIYNPRKTKFLLEAQKNNIATADGLYMLVAQAKRAAELFFGKPILDTETERVYRKIERQITNIVLIGMPSCGKTTIGQLIANKMKRTFVDTDEKIRTDSGMDLTDIIKNNGEPFFRTLETAAVKQIGKATGIVIATGGGIVTKNENFHPLKQNSLIFYLQRPLDKLISDGRPLSSTKEKIAALFEVRSPLYESLADYKVNSDNLEEAADEIIKIFNNYFKTEA